jgi:uncharacterized tellurite resistance protein B-like protein
MKSEIEKSWNRLAKLAKDHLAEGSKFSKLCRKHYGIHWQSIETLKDDDRIIDTIDYGYDTLSFKKFDAKVQAHIKKEGKSER